MAAFFRGPTSCAVLHSSDHVRLIATYLPVDDLLHVASLSRALHPLFDSEAVWLGRLKRPDNSEEEADASARSFMRGDTLLIGDCLVPKAAILSADELAALPPLPSLSEAAALCLRAYIARPGHHTRTRSCVAAIIHLPSTLLYHVRLLTDRHNNRTETDAERSYSMIPYPATSAERREYRLDYVEFKLRHVESEQQWTVESIGEPFNGWMAAYMDANVGVTAQPSDETTTAPFSSSKQRYINAYKCSEHEHTQCYRLLRLTPPRSVLYESRYLKHSPPVSPLPLCASCCTAIAACVERAGLKPKRVLNDFGRGGRWDHRAGVVRLNRAEYRLVYSYWSDEGVYTHFVRVRVAYRQHTDRQQQRRKSEEGGEGEQCYIERRRRSRPAVRVRLQCGCSLRSAGTVRCPKTQLLIGVQSKCMQVQRQRRTCSVFGE